MGKRQDNLNKIKKKQDHLEYQGEFTEPCVLKVDFFDENKLYPVDKNYQYLWKKRSQKIIEWFAIKLANIISELIGLYYGVKVVSRENAKQLKGKGIVTVSNHVLYLDNMVIRKATKRYHKIHYIVAEKNSVKGILGSIMRYGGTMPLSSNMRAMLNLSKAIKARIEQKRAVHFYAEAEMWIRYEKPRPLKEGAFYYACLYNAPVLPIFIVFRENGKLRKLFKLPKRITTHILEPIYKDEKLDQKSAMVDMRNKVEKAFVECYMREYNKRGDKLYNISEIGKEKISEHIELARWLK